MEILSNFLSFFFFLFFLFYFFLFFYEELGTKYLGDKLDITQV